MTSCAHLKGEPRRPLRLPIYGENETDRVVRDLWWSAAFGKWLVRNGGRARFGTLIDVIDAELDPSFASLTDAAQAIARWEEGKPWQRVRLQFLEAVDAWIGTALDARGRTTSPTWERHRCAAIAIPIRPWPTIGGVYFVLGGERIKIGKARDVARRLKELSFAGPCELHLLAVAPGGSREESEYHSRFHAERSHGEWFRFSPGLLRAIASVRAQYPEGAA